MDSFNARGCDEIMCQFIKNLDTSYDVAALEIYTEEEEIEPRNY
jgi:hypothetical protein